MHQLLNSKVFWIGCCLRLLAVIIWWMANCYAPVTTVAPLFLAVSAFTNLACGPALLREQYKSKEVFVVIFSILLVTVAAYIDSTVMEPWPSRSIWLVNLHNVQAGEGHGIVACSILWLAAVLYFLLEVLKSCLPCNPRRQKTKDKHTDSRHAIAIPVLTGLMSGAAYFEGYVGLPVCPALGISWHSTE